MNHESKVLNVAIFVLLATLSLIGMLCVIQFNIPGSFSDMPQLEQIKLAYSLFLLMGPIALLIFLPQRMAGN